MNWRIVDERPQHSLWGRSKPRLWSQQWQCWGLVTNVTVLIGDGPFWGDRQKSSSQKWIFSLVGLGQWWREHWEVSSCLYPCPLFPMCTLDIPTHFCFPMLLQPHPLGYDQEETLTRCSNPISPKLQAKPIHLLRKWHSLWYSDIAMENELTHSFFPEVLCFHVKCYLGTYGALAMISDT